MNVDDVTAANLGAAYEPANDKAPAEKAPAKKAASSKSRTKK